MDNFNGVIIGGIFGIIGTVAGTVLGFALNQLGSLKLFTQKWCAQYYDPLSDPLGGQYGNPISYDYNCQIVLFNTSNNNMIIRDITFNFYCGKKLLFKDSHLVDNHSGVVERVSAYTVQGKSVFTLALRSSLPDNASKMKNVTKVTLSYKGKKRNKVYEKRINSFEPLV